jgi:ribosomal protein S18 acetylase RimI-like enzyme
MGAEVHIRPLDEGDLAAYKALRDEMLAAHEDSFTSDAQAERAKTAGSYRTRFTDPVDPARFTLGAWRGDALVGAISCESDRRAKVSHIAHVAGMMVRPEAQRQGTGRLLMNACIAQARRVHGLEMLTLSVTSTNVRAIRLYESVGFTRYGRLVHALKIGDRYHDKDLMVFML